VSEQDDPLVRSAAEVVDRLLDEVDGKLPRKYGWRMTSEEAFARQSGVLQQQLEGGLATVADMNGLYWHDTARNIEAYGVMTMWRSAELVDAMLRSLNEGTVLAPAILARSLLELAVIFLYNANMVVDVARQVAESPDNQIATSQELEDLLLKAIWGTRLGEPPERVKQTNVLTRIEFLTKAPGASALTPAYEFLCEVAHPNVIGNFRFQAATSEQRDDGSEVITIDRDAHFLAADLIRERTLWALAWACYSLHSGEAMLLEAVRRILMKWPLPSSAGT
jgi:hypothetical protein